MRKLLLFILVSAMLLITPWAIISVSVANRVYLTIETIPTREVGLVLGTTPGIGGSNLFFTTRIEAAKELYERGKIRKIIVSGDNSDKSYNEPEYMRNALMKSGVPADAITMDYAGFRTLDSVVRASEVFSLTGGFTIISQPFHVERALYLARANGIDAIGY